MRRARVALACLAALAGCGDRAREWHLPDDATRLGPDWHFETDDITSVAPGVYHTEGTGGEVRLSVPSPPRAAWWRDVEMTGWFRATALIASDQLPHWELLARGERHNAATLDAADVNWGVPAPPGTRTFPGYPFPAGPLDPHCLGTSYHGNFYLSGTALFEKEVSHIAGYAHQRAETPVPFAAPMGRWFGMRFVARNRQSGGVHLELWLDLDGKGFQKVTETDDAPGAWAVDASSTLDGCDAAPFGYAHDEVFDWAGPWVIFRSDGMAIDFRDLEVREVGPID